MTIRFSSVKTLEQQLNMPHDKAQLLRRIIKRTPDNKKITIQEMYDLVPGLSEWSRQLHHPPKWRELKLQAANLLIEGHGVEAVFDEGEMWPWVEYVNTGDTYNVTIARLQNGGWRVACLGDLAEQHERENRNRRW